MGNGKLTEHAQNLQGCEKFNLRKAVGNLELPYGCEITVIAQEGLKSCYTSILYKLYKNCRIFTLRCLHNDLVPVSIKLKSTLKSERTKKILRMVEKQLLQTRLKSINSLPDDNAKQLELTRSKIASILTEPN